MTVSEREKLRILLIERPGDHCGDEEGPEEGDHGFQRGFFLQRREIAVRAVFAIGHAGARHTQRGARSLPPDIPRRPVAAKRNTGARLADIQANAGQDAEGFVEADTHMWLDVVMEKDSVLERREQQQHHSLTVSPAHAGVRMPSYDGMTKKRGVISTGRLRQGEIFSSGGEDFSEALPRSK
jgi:hypothetical protein